MPDHFLPEYFKAFRTIEGWFSFDAALMFMAYNQIIGGEGIAGNVLEIGVHHGLSGIGVAALRGPGCKFVAVDLFESLQEQNVSGSGKGDLRIFLDNMKQFYSDTGFVQPIARPSTELKPRDLGKQFSFCNIDGGHSQDETYHDLDLSWRVLSKGGLAALDDYFNPYYPGVSEGAVKFMLRHSKAFKPLAVGFNKVLLQKLPVEFDINEKFAAMFPRFRHLVAVTTMWNKPILLLDRCPLRAFVDLAKSEPSKLVPAGDVVFGVKFDLAEEEVAGVRGREAMLRVQITNISAPVLETVYPDIGLSYHLFSTDNAVQAWDNDRVSFTQPLGVGHSATLDLPIRVPEEAGDYLVEIDLVWERVMWFKETGNRTITARLKAV